MWYVEVVWLNEKEWMSVVGMSMSELQDSVAGCVVMHEALY